MSCLNCINLDPKKKQEDDGCYLFGCKEHGYVCDWAVDAKDLRNCSCRDFDEKPREEQKKQQRRLQLSYVQASIFD